MKYIKGKVKKFIYESSSGYKVGLFRIKDTDDEEMVDFINKTITFTGNFIELDMDSTYIFYGKLVYNDKYGYQYNVSEYKKQELTGSDAAYEFLTSKLVKGCGEKTAKSIVDIFKDDTISKIKESYTNLLIVPNMSMNKALNIYDSVIKYSNIDDVSIKLNSYGFSSNETLLIINKYQDNALSIVEDNPYNLINIIEFDKLDKVYLNIGSEHDLIRLKACFIETIKRLEYSNGDTYFYLEEIIDGLRRYFNIFIEDNDIDNIIKDNKDIVIVDKKYYLKETYNMEVSIAKDLMVINRLPKKDISIFDTEIIKLQESINVTYNEEQKYAIRSALENRVTIITGGPGTGKSTIVKAITNLYIKLNNIKNRDIEGVIALLAPTGRAAKKLADSTGLGASTIHRYLKWNKESNEFQVNEFNKNYHKLIIVDETSMVDTNLFYSLLKGIGSNIQLVLVGDSFQLPSVGNGLILNDLINSNMFTNCMLNHIYRQSSNSYIPILAKEIKDRCLSTDFKTKKDDYNFLEASGIVIKEMINKICSMSINKGLTDKDIEILVPMYKGVNGIDNLNIMLRELFNPKSNNKNEVKIGDIIYRVGDKVLQLVNDPDKGVFNGDIGYIKSIEVLKVPKSSTVITIDFDNNNVIYKKDEMFYVKHAYAISIHKSQGSEFPHVILPVCNSYNRMLYNKLIYTGVSRAKKSLVIIGEEVAFKMAINNDYSANRKTSLKERLLNNI